LRHARPDFVIEAFLHSMKYRESQKDKTLRAWFASDNAHALLRRIRLESGVLRGLNALDITFMSIWGQFDLVF